MAGVLGVPLDGMRDNANFDDLGLDSLTSIEALHTLKLEFGLKLPNDLFSRCSTSSSLQSFISSQLSAIEKAKSIVTPPESPVFPLTPNEFTLSDSPFSQILHLDSIPSPLQEPILDSYGSTPLFMIHDGSGLINHYDRLSDIQRPLYGIPNPHFLSSRPWPNLAAMAAQYARYISDITTGPVIIGGKHHSSPSLRPCADSS